MLRVLYVLLQRVGTVLVRDAQTLPEQIVFTPQCHLVDRAMKAIQPTNPPTGDIKLTRLYLEKRI